MSQLFINIFSCHIFFPGMKNREERSKHFFDSGPLMEEDDDLAVYEKVLILLSVFLNICSTVMVIFILIYTLYTH